MALAILRVPNQTSHAVLRTMPETDPVAEISSTWIRGCLFTRQSSFLLTPSGAVKCQEQSTKEEAHTQPRRSERGRFFHPRDHKGNYSGNQSCCERLQEMVAAPQRAPAAPESDYYQRQETERCGKPRFSRHMQKDIVYRPIEPIAD